MLNLWMEWLILQLGNYIVKVHVRLLDTTEGHAGKVSKKSWACRRFIMRDAPVLF